MARRPVPGLVPGVLLIALGGFLLLREFNIIPASIHLIDLWPLIVVVLGLKALIFSRGFTSILFALAFVALGAALLIGNLGLVPFPIVRLWPALFLILGLALLFGNRGVRKPLGPGGYPGRGTPPGEDEYEAYAQESYVTDDDAIDKQINLSGAEIKVESQAWKGGYLGVTAGGVELDLRYATLASRDVTLELQVKMGGVDIRVPQNWQVFCDVTPLLGGVDDVTRSPQGASDPPRLRVRGSVTFGGVTVRN